MAEIIDLERHRGYRRSQAATAHGARPRGPATILLFLGVRYERHGETVGSALLDSPLGGRGKTPPRRRRKRAS